MTAKEPLRDTARRFGFEIAAITVGILIALSIDAVVQRNRERALVQQARAAIAREIADNSKDLEGGLKSLDKHVQDLAQGLRLADDLLKDGKSDIHELNLGFSFPSLNRAAWQTAERTGALALMDYDDVKELSEICSSCKIWWSAASDSCWIGWQDSPRSWAPARAVTQPSPPRRTCRCFARGCSMRAGRSAYTARWPPAWRTPIACASSLDHADA